MRELLNTGVNINLDYYAEHDALIGQIKGYSVAVKENLSTNSYGCLFWVKKGEFGALTTAEQYLEEQQKKSPDYLKKFVVNETGVAVALARTSDEFFNVNNLKRFIYDFTSALSLNNYENCCCECGSRENLSIYDTEGAIAQACSSCGVKYIFIRTCKSSAATGGLSAFDKKYAPFKEKVEIKPEIKPEIKAEEKPQIKPQIEIEEKPEVKIEEKLEIKVEEKIEAKPEEKTESAEDALFKELKYIPDENKPKPVRFASAPVAEPEEFSLKEFEYNPDEKQEEEPAPVIKEEKPVDLSSLMFDESEKREEPSVQAEVPAPAAEEPIENFSAFLYEEAKPEPEKPKSKLFEEAEREFAAEKAKMAAEEAKLDNAVDDLIISDGEIVIREATAEIDDGSHDVTEVYDDSNDGEDFDIEEIESTVEMPTVTTGHPQLEAEETPLEEDGSVPLINPNSHREERQVSAVDGPDAVQPLDYGQAHVTYEKLSDETAPRFSAGGEINRGYTSPNNAPPPYNPNMDYSSYARTAKIADSSNIVMGIIGALVVGLAGVAVWLILGHFFNVIHSVGCVAVILTVYAGYFLGGRSLDRKGIVTSFIITFVMVLAGFIGVYMLDVIADFSQSYGISISLGQAFDWVNASVEVESYRAEFLMNLAVSMIATLIGNVITAVNCWKRV